MATTHGFSGTKLYRTWKRMKACCLNKNFSTYYKYGGKGIQICDEWKNNFVLFKNWALSNGYNDNLTIDRIDPYGNYEPSNCRWINIKGQENNKTNNHLITFNGEIHTMAEWGDITGISNKVIEQRINKLGWKIEDALTKPTRKCKKGVKRNAKL